MSSPVASDPPDVRGVIALTDENDLVIIALPYAGRDPHGALRAWFSRRQGFGSCITGGAVFDHEGGTLAQI
jgi:hypothetical protein